MVFVLLVPFVLVACGEPRRATSDRVSLSLDSSAERRISLRDVLIEPADNVESARLDARGVIAIARVDQSRALRITAPNMCPVSVPPGPQPDALVFKHVLSLGGDRTGIGFGARFTVQAQLNCAPQPQLGKIAWQQLEGPTLSDLEVSDAGFVLNARIARLGDDEWTASQHQHAPAASAGAVAPQSFAGAGAPSDERSQSKLPITGAGTRNEVESPRVFAAADGGVALRDRELPTSRGIVPISPRTQGRVVLQARWEAPGFAPATRQLVVSAAARATGLSSVAVSQPLVLEGTGWSVKTRPPGGHASVKALEGLTFFTADAPGSWTLTHDDRHTLKLQSLTHDATPYDCGRAECHAALSEHTAESAMSHALQRPLEAGADPAAVGCMIDCHVLGERGLSDGGFQAVAARLGFTWSEHTRWEDLPQALRRAGGVRCTACHGPGAIPPPEQRSAILESDVCATCHDAPPRYVHVTQWRSSRMAISDRDPATRQAECARCHTTAGFLAHNGVRKLSDEAPRTPPTGIACAACHAPHSGNRGPRLIRDVEVVAHSGEVFPEAATTLCRSCHAPSFSQPIAALAALGEQTLPPLRARASSPQSAAGSSAGSLTVLPDLPVSLRASSPSLSRSTSTVFVGPTPSGSLFASEIRVPAREVGAWDLVRARSVHEQVPRGCIGCHGGGALQANAIDHSFRAEPQVCATCHANDALSAGRVASDALHARALAVSLALAPHCQSGAAPVPHLQLTAAGCSDSALERARYETNLVLDDNAALFHNADLSRALLDEAEQILSGFRGL